jgi:hypothetical protein
MYNQTIHLNCGNFPAEKFDAESVMTIRFTVFKLTTNKIARGERLELQVLNLMYCGDYTLNFCIYYLLGYLVTISSASDIKLCVPSNVIFFLIPDWTFLSHS